jgi:hypothetical protein
MFLIALFWRLIFRVLLFARKEKISATGTEPAPQQMHRVLPRPKLTRRERSATSIARLKLTPRLTMPINKMPSNEYSASCQLIW